MDESIVAILFSFLILSFAVWGIADMIRNVGQVNVARVGSTDITALAYRDTYQTELQNLSRRARRAITNDEAAPTRPRRSRCLTR